MNSLSESCERPERVSSEKNTGRFNLFSFSISQNIGKWLLLKFVFGNSLTSKGLTLEGLLIISCKGSSKWYTLVLHLFRNSGLRRAITHITKSGTCAVDFTPRITLKTFWLLLPQYPYRSFENCKNLMNFRK